MVSIQVFIATCQKGYNLIININNNRKINNKKGVKTNEKIIIKYTKTEYVLEEEKFPLCISLQNNISSCCSHKPSGNIINSIQVPWWNLQVCWSDHICRNRTESTQIRP